MGIHQPLATPAPAAPLGAEIAAQRDYRLAEMELWSVAAKRAARIADRVHPLRRINASGWEGAAMLFDPARHSYRRQRTALFNQVRERMIAKLAERGFIEQSVRRLNAEIAAIRLRERTRFEARDGEGLGA